MDGQLHGDNNNIPGEQAIMEHATDVVSPIHMNTFVRHCKGNAMLAENLDIMPNSAVVLDLGNQPELMTSWEIKNLQLNNKNQNNNGNGTIED